MQNSLHRIINIHHFLVIFAIALLSLLTISIFGLPKKAFAAVPQISNVAPVDGSGCVTGSNCGTSTHPWFAVGTGGYDGKFSYAKIYVPSGQSTTLTVHQGYGVCAVDLGSPKVNYRLYLLGPDEGMGGSQPPLPFQPSNTDRSCGTDMVFNSGNNSLLKCNAKDTSTVFAHSDFCVFYFKATITPMPGANEKNFRLRVDSGSYVGVSKPVEDLGTSPWFGIYQHDLPSAYGGASNWNWSVQYGPTCLEDPQVTNRYVFIYDIDWQKYNQPVLRAFIQKDARDDNTFNWQAANYTTNGNVVRQNAPSPFDESVTSGSGYVPSPNDSTFGPARGYDHNPINFNSGSHRRDDLAFNSVGTNRYRLFFQDINYINTIQVRLPFDQIDGTSLIDCASQNNGGGGKAPTYGALCKVSAGGQAYSSQVTVGNLSPNQNVNASYKVTNNGTNLTWDTSNVEIVKTVTNNGVPDPAQTQVGTISTNGGVSSLAPNDTLSFSRTHTAPSAVPGTKVITYTMRRTDTGASFGTPCKLTLKVAQGACSGTCVSGSIAAACGSTEITGVKSSAKYLDIKTGSIRTIPDVPVKIVIEVLTGPGAGTTNDFIVQGGVPNASADVGGNGYLKINNTFGMWGGMWPHGTYRLHLFVQYTDPNSFTSNSYGTQFNNNSWTDGGGVTFFNPNETDTSDVGDCLHTDCGTTTVPDVEPGETTKLNAGVIFHNQTETSYDTNSTGGYYFHIDIQPGIFGNSVDPALTDPPNSKILPGDPTVSASFNGRVDYRGKYSVTLYFQGKPLDISSNGSGPTCTSPNITPATRPYLQVWGGDINTGGGFFKQDAVDGSYYCPGTYPDYVSPPSAASAGKNIPANFGGIKTYGAGNGTYGSLTDFGAVALGLIAKKPLNASNDPPRINFGAQPTFANVSSPYYGQLNATQDYCAPDFYDQYKKNPAPLAIAPPTSLSDLVGSITGQYEVTQDVPNFAGTGQIIVPTGTKVTLYVTGNVTINNNIIYDSSWNVDDPDTAPSFTLVVKGNINISKNVTRVDGLYVAQPTNGNDGELNTCATNDGNQFCSSQLVMNGAVVARRILPLRSSGTVYPLANPAFNPPPGHQAAEIFNFVPSMVVSNPNFAPINNPNQGFFSLPPVF